MFWFTPLTNHLTSRVILQVTVQQAVPFSWGSWDSAIFSSESIGLNQGFEAHPKSTSHPFLLTHTGDGCGRTRAGHLANGRAAWVAVVSSWLFQDRRFEPNDKWGEMGPLEMAWSKIDGFHWDYFPPMNGVLGPYL